MTSRHFIFEPGQWIGEGKINFSESPTTLHFYTQWLIQHFQDKGKPEEFRCIQTVEIQGGDEKVQNRLSFSNVQNEKFSVTLQNDLVTLVKGKGIIEEKKVAWEFRGRPYFEGFEVYDLQEDGDYLFHAEYISQDQLRSIIEGRIWKKSVKPQS